MKTASKFKKTPLPIWIGALALVFAIVGCTKPDDNNGGGEITPTDTIQPVDPVNPDNPNSTIVGGVLPGVFSVNSEQQIHFSQGNLQYQASTSTWRFAENQWVIMGESNENISPTYNGWIDLFGWGTSGWDCGNTYYQPWDSDNSNGSLYGPPGLSPLTGPYSHSDWGVHNAISNGGNLAGQWHTLTYNDWEYLYYTRNTPSDIRFAMGKVSGVKGVILLPDDWSSSTYTLNNTNQYDASFDSNVISASKWLNELQPNGAVFLPCAGSRHGTSFSNGGNGGAYWSSGIWYLFDGYYGYGEYLPIRYPIGGDFLLDRFYGLAVRLVQSVQNNNNNTEIQVITHTPSEISQASACCGCEVLVPQGQTVTEIGVCWSTSPNPTINDYHLSTTNWNEPFVCTITGLTQGTTYYVRAYATNNDGTVYGEQKMFTTTSLTIPSVITNDVIDIAEATATCGGNVTSDGGSSVTSRGICWSTTPNPTTNDNHSESGMGIGSFTVDLTGLTYNTNYYVRAYAINDIGIGYGEQKSFTTTMPLAPEGSINGLFSVSPTQQVYFSQGNLQYQASTNTWRFAENQWDFVGIGNNNISQNYNGWIDLFGWGTSGWNCGNTYYQPWDWDATNTNGFLFGPPGSYNLTENYANSDWGVYNVINNGGSTIGQWRTLSNEEWYYILNSRSGLRYAKATVNGVRGIVLFPDGWNNYTPSYANHNEVDFSWNSYSSSQWDWLEQRGVVFICAAGQMLGNSIKYNGIRGYYWSSSHGGTHGAQGLYFSHEALGANSGYVRCHGASVRLVRNAE